MKKFVRSNKVTRLSLAIIRSMRWLFYYLKYSATISVYAPQHSKAWILKEAHTIEKGLSFSSIRPYFGSAKRTKLLSEVERSRLARINDAPRSIAAKVLDEYIAWHEKNDHTNDEMRALEKIVNGLERTVDCGGGTIPYRADYTPEARKMYDSIVTERRSVRNFRPDLIPASIIVEAIRIANYSPSVCNRQSWAVSLVQNPKKVRQMLDLQNGNKGFDETIGNIIIVLADVRGFLDEYEIFEPFVDAGIFSGALVNVLNAHNIGSCCLNLCVSHHKAMNIASALELEPGLFPVMMIACGYVADDCQVAMSSRLDPSIFLR